MKKSFYKPLFALLGIFIVVYTGVYLLGVYEKNKQNSKLSSIVVKTRDDFLLKNYGFSFDTAKTPGLYCFDYLPKSQEASSTLSTYFVCETNRDNRNNSYVSVGWFDTSATYNEIEASIAGTLASFGNNGTGKFECKEDASWTRGNNSTQMPQQLADCKAVSDRGAKDIHFGIYFFFPLKDKSVGNYILVSDLGNKTTISTDVFIRFLAKTVKDELRDITFNNFPGVEKAFASNGGSNSSSGSGGYGAGNTAAQSGGYGATGTSQNSQGNNPSGVESGGSPSSNPSSVSYGGGGGGGSSFGGGSTSGGVSACGATHWKCNNILWVVGVPQETAAGYSWKCYPFGMSFLASSCFEAKPSVNGACGLMGPYTCLSGTLANSDSNKVANYDSWDCLGSGGGTTASCSLPRSIDGACGTAKDTCAAGNLGDIYDMLGIHHWYCNGINSGKSKSCTYVDSNQPVVNGSCNNTAAYACNAGTPNFLNYSSTAPSPYKWACLGSNGGWADWCSYDPNAVVTTPINAVCNNAVMESCSVGSYVTDSTFTLGSDTYWTCQSPNGGSDDTCMYSPSATTVTATLSADKTLVNYGDPVKLTWTSTGAASCTGTGFSTGNATSNGTGVTVNPTTTTTYSISCDGVVSSKTVSVTSATASLTASQTSVSSGDPVKLTWTSTNASSCTGTGFSTGNATSNSAGVIVNPVITTTYILNCGGAVSAKTVAVASLPYDMSVSAYPKTMPAGSATSLSWSITNPSTSCMIKAQPVCTGTCSSARTAAVAAVNSLLQTGYVDSNDPYSIGGSVRTIKKAVQKPAPNNNPSGKKAMGKKSVQLNFTTDFILDCGTGSTKKVRVNVSTDHEG